VTSHQRLELFTAEDAKYLAATLSAAGLWELRWSKGIEEVFTVTVIRDLEELDLEALVTSEHGITDPIGQLQQWLYDRMSELASWFAQTVEEIGRRLWDTVAKPFLDTIKNLVEQVWSFLQQIPGTVENALDWLSRQISGVWSWIQEDIIDPLFSAINNLMSWISQGISTLTTFFTETVPQMFAELQKWISDISTLINDYVVTPLLTAVNNLIETITRGLDTVTSFVSQIPAMVQQAVGELATWIQENVVAPLSNAFSQLIQLISSGLETVSRFFTEELPAFVSQAIASIQQTLSGIATWVQENVVAPLTAAFQSFIDFINSGLQTVSRFFTEELPSYINSFVAQLRDAVAGIASWIQQNVIAPLTSAVQSILSAVQQGLGSVSSAIASMVSQIQSALAGIWSFIQSNVLAPLRGALENLIGFISEGFETVRSFIAETLPSLVDQVKEAVAGLGTWISENVVKPITEAFTQFLDMVRSGLETVARFFTEQFPSLVSGVVEEIQRIPQIVFGTLREVGISLWDYLTKLGTLVSEGFAKLGEALTKVSENLKLVGVYLTGFVNAVMQLPERLVTTVWNSLQWIGQKIVEGAQWLWNILTGLGNWFVSAFKTLASWVGRAVMTVISVIGEVGKDIATAIGNAMKAITNLIVARSSPALYEILASPWFPIIEAILLPLTPIMVEKLGEVIEEAKKNPVRFIYNLLNVGVLISAAIYGVGLILKPLVSALPDTEISGEPLGVGARIRLKLKDVLEKAVSQFEKFMPDVARYMIIGHMIWWAEPTRAITRYNLTEYVTVELPPMEHTLNLVRRSIPTPILMDNYKMFVDQLRMGGIYKGFIERIYGLNTKLAEEVAKQLGNVSELYDRELGALRIWDRFTSYTRKERLFPVSMVWAIPSPSELARMMVRDIIQDPRHFAAVMAMHGFTPDVAFMFYLLHYRYPPPEKLAEFFWRGIAGELWNPEAPVDENIMKTFGLDPTVVKAVAPKELNFRYDLLQKMISTYMKWHDYARFPWQPGWPTDNAIMIELMADIPTKIDLRWMTRWGLFDYWSAYGIGLKKAIHEITKSLIPEGTTASARPMADLYLQYLKKGEIVFDLKQFCRVLQATGIHPYWIPWVAIAETINALTEERTLLRTGFINLYKEGIWSLDHLHQLLSGFFTVKFEVGYFDLEKRDWVSATVEYPIAFLPAESKLLEIRATMDRALDIYREAYRYIIRSVAYYVVDPAKAREIIADIVSAINEKFFKQTVKSLTGKELSLVLDTGYWEAWSKYAEAIIELEARERTRFYARYLLWSVLWALRYGYVTIDEAKGWVSKLVEKMHEHPIVREAIELSVEFMVYRFEREVKAKAIINLLRSRRIAVSEAIEQLKKLGFSEDLAKKYIDANVVWYTPGLTTYATLLEIVPEAISTSLKALEHFNMPSDELQYWRLYVARKPIQDELTLLRTRIYNALALGMGIDEVVDILSKYSMKFTVRGGELVIEGADEAKKLLAFYDANRDVFQAFGIAPHEWVMYNVIAAFERRIDELRQAARERIPSPSTLAVLAEYLALPKDLVEEALKRYGVSEKWREIWEKYIEVKPLKSDYKAYISVAIRAYLRNVIEKKRLDEIIDKAKEYGFTDEEIKILRDRIDLEEKLEEAKVRIPTPSQLATLAEYIVLPEDKVLSALKYHRVADEWIDYWKKYIEAKPIKSDVKSLLSVKIRALRYGVITKKELEEFIDKLGQYGFTSKEIEFIKERVDLEEEIAEAMELRRAYLPTPTMLATLAEYLVLKEDLIRKVLEARRVPQEWIDIWLKYIQVRPVKSDYKAVLSVAARALRYGVISEDEWKKLLDDAKSYGFTPKEIELIEKRVYYELLIESAREYVPSLGTIASMVEYIEVPRTIIDRVLQLRRVPKDFADLWLRYIEARSIAGEVNQLVAEYRRLYEYFTVSREVASKVAEWMRKGGWVGKELEVFSLALQLRKEYRVLSWLVPTIRQLVADARYIPEWEQILSDVLRARGIDVARYQKQIEYYKKLARNRIVWRQIAWYRNRLVYAYANGIIDRNTLIQKLQALKKYGLTDDEIALIVDGAELEKKRIQTIYGR